MFKDEKLGQILVIAESGEDDDPSDYVLSVQVQSSLGLVSQRLFFRTEEGRDKTLEKIDKETAIASVRATVEKLEELGLDLSGE